MNYFLNNFKIFLWSSGLIFKLNSSGSWHWFYVYIDWMTKKYFNTFLVGKRRNRSKSGLQFRDRSDIRRSDRFSKYVERLPPLTAVGTSLKCVLQLIASFSSCKTCYWIYQIHRAFIQYENTTENCWRATTEYSPVLWTGPVTYYKCF